LNAIIKLFEYDSKNEEVFSLFKDKEEYLLEIFACDENNSGEIKISKLIK
jgi:hypothetical protein